MYIITKIVQLLSVQSLSHHITICTSAAIEKKKTYVTQLSVNCTCILRRRMLWSYPSGVHKLIISGSKISQDLNPSFAHISFDGEQLCN